MAVVSAGELRNRVEVLRRTGRINPLGEQTYDYETERRVWAKIVPTAGADKINDIRSARYVYWRYSTK